MKKRLSMLTMTIVMLLALCACAQSAPATPAPTPEPTPEPTPVPPTTVHVIADCSEEEAADFFDGVMSAAETKHWDVTTEAAPSRLYSVAGLSDAEALILYITDADRSAGVVENVLSNGKTVVVLDAAGGAPVSGADYMTMTRAGAETDYVIESALTYPPHDTPVRIIALFSGEGSAADEAYQAKYAEGWIYPKATYYAESAETSLEEWLTERMERYIEGTADCILAEGELAAETAKILKSLGRTDTEVFCIGYSESIVAQIEATPEILVLCAGSDLYGAGADRVEALDLMLHGAAPQQSVLDLNKAGSAAAPKEPQPAEAPAQTEAPTPEPMPTDALPQETADAA